MIRHLQADELPLILPLVAQVQALHVRREPGYFQPDQDAAALIGFFSARLAEGQTLLIDERQGRVAGYALFFVDERPENLFSKAHRVGHLDQICVDHGFRRQGVGRALIGAMQAQLRAPGIDGWTADYWAFNAASDALMRSSGARPFCVMVRGKTG